MDKLMMLKKAVQEAVVADPLSNYKLSDTVRAVGFRKLFKATDATVRSTGEQVTVLVCSYAYVEERCGGNREEAAALLQKLRDGVTLLARLRHPHVVRLVMPLTEDKPRGRFVFVVERVQRWISDESAVSDTDTAGNRIETIFGMHQIGCAIDFLHQKAGVLLVQFSPSNIAVTPSGQWKVADFTHAVNVSQDSLKEAVQLVPCVAATQFRSVSSPSLDFIAPEIVDHLEKSSIVSSSGSPQTSSATQKPSVMVDLFSDFHTAPASTQGGKGKHQDGPCFPDSDIVSFLLATFAVVERRSLIRSANEVSVYRRQLQEAAGDVRRLYPQWGNIAETPRVPLAHILQTEIFAAKEIRLLAQIPELVSFEPKSKLAILKGLHDEISKDVFSSEMLDKWLLDPLVLETSDERMLKYIVPILLEAAGCTSSHVFDSKLRSLLTSVIQRGAATKGKPAGADPLGDVLLAQVLDKFGRLFKQLSNPKDLQQFLKPLVCAGLSATQKDTVRSALKALDILLINVERPFPCSDEVAHDVLSAAMSCPDSAPATIACLKRLLPFTTRSGREAQLEPSLIRGLKELSSASSVSSDDVSQLLKVLMSIVSESSVDHIANQTLPLLCPLLLLRQVAVRHHVSTYVNELVQMVITKKNEEEDSERRDVAAQDALRRAPSLAEVAATKSPNHNVAVGKEESTSVSFFDSAAPPLPAQQQSSAIQHHDPFLAPQRNLHRDNGAVYDAFGF